LDLALEPLRLPQALERRLLLALQTLALGRELALGLVLHLLQAVQLLGLPGVALLEFLLLRLEPPLGLLAHLPQLCLFRRPAPGGFLLGAPLLRLDLLLE